MDTKKILRIKAKTLRKTLDIENLSDELTSLITTSHPYKSAKNVMIYYPLKYEINLLSLLKDNKNFYLPRIEGNNIEVCPYKKSDYLKTSELNIPEPITDKANPNILDLIIVPAILVDENNYRLGYGGGYYDRFLAQNKKIKTLCAIPKALVVKNLPHENYDIKIDTILSI